MSTVDRRLKAVTVKYIKDGKFKIVQLIELDKVDIKFYDVDNTLVHIETGEIIKIGSEDDKPYIILVPYNIYLDQSIYNVSIDRIVDIINVNRGPVYSLSPVYSSDESVAALRREGNHLQFTTNGKDWIDCAGTGSDITIDDVDREIDKALEDYDDKAAVDEKISSATSGLASETYVDNTIATNLEEYDKSTVIDSKISNATSGLASETYVNETISTNLEEYDKSTVIDSKISNATADLAPKNNPTFTGTVNIPTPTPETDDTTAASTAYVADAIRTLKQQLAGALHFKGVLDTYEELLALEEKDEGDVWQVRTSPFGENAEFAWTNSSGWIELGTVIDLSAYETKAEATAAINAAIETANSYTDQQIAEIADIYELCVEKGYRGNKDDFCSALADLCNNVFVIPTILDENADH